MPYNEMQDDNMTNYQMNEDDFNPCMYCPVMAGMYSQNFGYTPDMQRGHHHHDCCCRPRPICPCPYPYPIFPYSYGCGCGFGGYGGYGGFGGFGGYGY